MAELYKKSTTPALTGGLLLYALAIPVAVAVPVSVMRGDAAMLLAQTGGLLLLVGGAMTNRAGLKFQALYDRRKVAAAPALPRKLIGALLTGAGTAVLSYFALGDSTLFAALVGVGAVAGCTLAYGRDPRGDKVAEGAARHGYTAEEITRALAEAEDKVRAIEAAAKQIRNAELKSRLRRIAAQARKITGVIEEDPGDLRRARKFLNVYLDGARRVTEGYASTHTESQSQELESNFRNVLVTIEQVFGEQHQKLLQNDVMDLDVQIEVLSTQLQREGVV